MCMSVSLSEYVSIHVNVMIKSLELKSLLGSSKKNRVVSMNFAGVVCVWG